MDRNHADRLRLRHALESAGHVVTEADHVRFVEASALAPLPALVIVSLGDVGRQSEAAGEQLRQRLPHVPMLVLLESEDELAYGRAYELGAADVMVRGSSSAGMVSRVAFVLRASRKLAELRDRDAESRACLKAIPDRLLLVSAGGVIEQQLNAVEQPMERGGLGPADGGLAGMLPAAVAAEFQQRVVAVLQAREATVYRFSIDTPGGIYHYEASLQPYSERLVLAVLQDATERGRSQEKLHQLAFYDALTGLPNRTLFLDRCAQAIQRAQRTGRSVGLMHIDLDDFKRFNDSLGHATGDVLLKLTAARLESSVRGSDSLSRTGAGVGHDLARLGGDEFSLLIGELEDEQQLAAVADRILAAFNEPLTYSGREFAVTPSIGIALYPADGEDVDGLLRHADAAMYRAKASGKDTYRFSSDTLVSRCLEDFELELDLRRAVQEGAFELWYQPKVDLASCRICGLEALLRWQRPDQSWVSPAVVVARAEGLGLIDALGDWVLKEACRQGRLWEAQGLAMPIAVNVSRAQFSNALGERILRFAWEAGLKPSLLQLEITEGSLLDDRDPAIAVLTMLRKAGVRIAIDDFGTGYSSLAYLKRLPVDTLKIDQSFVRQLPFDSDDVAICRAIISMARSLGLEVVAEGVENEAQLEFLRAHQCQQVQGYYYCPPRPAADIEKLLREHQIPMPRAASQAP